MWRIGYNEIYKLYNVALSTFLHLKRLQWADHIARMDDSPIPKKVMDMLEEEGFWESLVLDGRML